MPRTVFAQHRPASRLSWWLLLCLGLLLCAVTGWGVWSVYQQREQRHVHQMEAALNAINSLQLNAVAGWRRDRRNDAQALSDNDLLGQAVGQWRQQPTPLGEQQLRQRLRSIVEHQQYTAAYLLDPQGRILLHSDGAQLSALPAPEQQALPLALQSAQPQVLGLQRDAATAFAYYSQITPLFMQDQPVAAIWLVMDANTSLYPRLELGTTNSRSVESLLLRIEGAGVRFLSPLRQRADAPLTLYQAGADQSSLELLMHGARGTFYGRDYRGEPVLATVSAVPDSDWLLITKMDIAEAFSDAQQREWLTMLAYAVLGLVSVGALIMLWQWSAWRRERSLKEELQTHMQWLETAQQAATMGYFVYYGATHDFTLSPMAARIFGLPQGQLSANLKQWQALLHPDDLAHALQVHEQAMTQRLPLRLQYRIVRADDQAPRWVEIWGNHNLPAPTQALAGKAQSMTGTVQDITERKQAEEQLERYRLALETRVRIDPLTQVANRGAFDEVLTQEWARAERSGAPLALLMIDIDYFKAFNDHYGHQAGDRCLKAVANAIGSQIGRAGDLLARYGGEEFVVLLPGADLAQASAVGQRLLQAVALLRIEHAALVPAGWVSISLGCTSMAGPQITANPMETLIRQADSALYQAKAQGRNRLVCWGAEDAPVLHEPPDSLYGDLI